jgi:ubiquinone/menaquinone biosynthesis C-methylase UbiE
MSQPRADYDAWHDRVSSTEALDTPWHRLVQETLSVERDLTARRVLEIACGRGEFADWCASHSTPSMYIAADFSMSAVRLARARDRRRAAVNSKLRFVQADAQRIALPSASVDTVICCETIEHVPEPRAALGELARVLRPGGRLFLTCPNYLGPIGLYRGYLRLTGRRFTEEGQPINHFLLAPRVRQWVKAAGLRVIVARGRGHYLPFPGRPPILLADRAPGLGVVGLHVLTVAEKPR